MNTRLKFRVWYKEGKYYRPQKEKCGLFVISGDGSLWYHYYDTAAPILEYGNLIPCGNSNFVLEQCTGLSDANGRLIYEGDIIAGEDPYCSHLVEWDEKEATFYVVLLPTTKITTIRGTIRKDWIDEFQKHVIGNIHENPELLEDKK